MISLLRQLCAPIAVSGREKALRCLLISLLTPHCRLETDRAGNLIARKNGAGPAPARVVLFAHMDEVGLMITDITDRGFLRFAAVGGIDPRIFPGKSVTLQGTDGPVSGVIGIVPPHFLKGEDARRVPREEDLLIDIGAENAEEAESRVRRGDVGVLNGDFTTLGSDKILSRALDDRAGCAVLVWLLQQPLPYDITAVFTVQEELGCRGAAAAAAALCPEISLVLDATTACDLPDVSSDKTVCCLHAGGVVSFMDRGCVYDKQLFDLLLETAERSRIPVQVKRAVAGANDSAGIFRAPGGVRTASLCLPCRYLHTPGCVIDRQDLTSVGQLALALLPRLSEL